MIQQFEPDTDIARHWNSILFAALEVYQHIPQDRIAEFSYNLLANLLAGKFQAWAVLDDRTRTIKLVAITSIKNDIGDLPYLFIDCAYGYAPSNEDDKRELIDRMKVFAQNRGCVSVFALVTNPLAENAARKSGLVETSKIFSCPIGG